MNKKITSLPIVQAAFIAALLISGKFVISFIPNVEVVTLFIFVFSAFFPLHIVLPAVCVFCAADMLLYPFSPDVAISYFVFYPLLCIIAKLLNKKEKASEIKNALAAFMCTLFFGIITSFFFYLFYAQSFLSVYLSGIVFYAVHAASNLLIVLFLFQPLTKILKKHYRI